MNRSTTASWVKLMAGTAALGLALTACSSDDGDTEAYKLDEVGHASALALDSDDHLLVLDSTNKVVHSFTFEPGDD